MDKKTEGENIVGQTVATTEVTLENKLTKEVTPLENMEEDLGFEVFKTAPAVVTLRKGKTINIGNFESIRVEVGVSLPCYKETVDDTYSIANTWTDERLTTLLKKVEEGQIAKKKNGPAKVSGHEF